MVSVIEQSQADLDIGATFRETTWKVVGQSESQ